MNTYHSTHRLFEGAFDSDRTYSDPIRDVTLTVRFTSPTGFEYHADTFWDGGAVWRVRFAVDEPGDWRYETSCSDINNNGLHAQRGTFHVDAYTGDNPLYVHGPIQVSADRRFLVHADGTPFFWLADTAWNGVLKAKPADWDRYLSRRREQGFTAIQAVLTQWRAFAADEAGEVAFSGREQITINPAFYQRIDDKVAVIAQHGLVPALVLIWACTPIDPGHYLGAEDCIVLARYEAARYHAYRAVWLLGGDGEYSGEHADKWRQTGRAVFGQGSSHVVTMHPRGINWPNEDLRQEPWLSFASYQSGHGDSEGNLRWLTQGPPAHHWDETPPLPIINQEPNYEHHVSYHSRGVFGPHEVRRALYWSLLVTPTAGVTYGHHGIWPWMEERAVPKDHAKSGEAPPWWEAVDSPGATSVMHLRRFFDEIEWWRLRPAQDWLSEQPGIARAEEFVAVARAEDDSLAVAYTPTGDPIALRAEATAHFGHRRWYDPRNGAWQEAIPDDAGWFTPPDRQDWVLLLTDGSNVRNGHA